MKRANRLAFKRATVRVLTDAALESVTGGADDGTALSRGCPTVTGTGPSANPWPTPPPPPPPPVAA